MKAYTRKQRVIAKSSAEAELYAAALGASEAKGVQSMMRDLGFAVKPLLNIDAKGHRTHSPQAGNREAEAHRCGELAGTGASAQSQERSKRRRLGHETTQQNCDCEPLSHVGIRGHGRRKCSEWMASSGDVLGLRFSSQLTAAGSR